MKSRCRLYFNLFVVWILTGIWHGSSWNFVFWGLAYFVLIAFEKGSGLPDKLKSKFGKLLYRIFTLFVINFQWVIFRADGLRKGLNYIRHMFYSAPNALADARAMFLWKDYAPFILMAAVLCFPIIPAIRSVLERNRISNFIWNVFFVVATAALFIWALSFVVAGQNNPFAYANF